MKPRLQAVTRACRRKAGRLQQIQLIDPDDVLSIPPYYLLPNIDAIVLKPGRTFYAFENDHLTGRLEDNTDTAARPGDVITYKLSALVKNQSLDIEYLRSHLLNRRIHVLATDHGGLIRFIPNMRLSASLDSGARITDKNDYSFTGTARLHKPAPALNATLIEETGSGGGTVPEESDETFTMVTITTSASTYTYTVPAGHMLMAVFVKSTADQTVILGSSAGADDLGGPLPLLALQKGKLGDNLLEAETGTPIYFSGLAGTNTIKIYLA